MNLLLFDASQRQPDGRFRLSERQLRHLREVVKPVPGSVLKAGLRNGMTGEATLCDDLAHVCCIFDTPPPEAPELVLVLALPRPKVFRRVLRTAVEIGVKKIHFVGTWKVEKSYWNTPFLAQDVLQSEIDLAMEQAADTMEPVLAFHRHFKPFAEDVLPELICNKRFLYAHPGGETAPVPGGATVLAIGPEGGFTDYECCLMDRAGGVRIGLGKRIQRTESALPVLAGCLLYPFFASQT